VLSQGKTAQVSKEFEGLVVIAQRIWMRTAPQDSIVDPTRMLAPFLLLSFLDKGMPLVFFPVGVLLFELLRVAS
jgi:hypothetical protein